MFRGTPTPHSVTHPSTISALRADPPSPTRGKERRRCLLRPRKRQPQAAADHEAAADPGQELDAAG
ncbi:hypothetical protein FJ979_32250 [Mesorhizobium sp. B1-1-6]|nr:hypothetical protein FJ489_32880 [Mesorhizobium sp. B2-5-12]TPK22178.1 hypothetical protein FJ562_24045 [Mesorhizobium sp. B2-5-6]TPN28774.1 hypothetical protein FJ979_32250 [Mesorhizobium sp. B1-1-6]